MGHSILGVQTGFGALRGAALYARLRDDGWTWARVGVSHQQPDRAVFETCVQEVIDGGMKPLCLMPVRGPQGERLGEWVPRGLDVEYYGATPDPTKDGQEADNRKEDPGVFTRAILDAMPMHRDLEHQVWAPALSNPSKAALAWLARFVAAGLPQDVGISYHRYPDYGMKRGGDGRRGFKGLQAELLALQTIAAGRPLAMTEGCWHMDWMWRWEGDVWKWLKIGRYRLTHDQCAANWALDARLAESMGVQLYIWYQIGGPTGLLDDNGTARPEARIPTLV